MWRCSKRPLKLWIAAILAVATTNLLFLLHRFRSVASGSAAYAKRMLPWYSLAAGPRSNATVLSVQSQVKVLLGVFTMRQEAEGHDTVRRTWMRQPGVCSIADPLAQSCRVVVAFVVGGSAAVVKVEGDFLILNIAENMNSGKSYFFFSHAARAFSWVTHIGKIDMDTFPFLPKLFAMVPPLAKAPYAYLGWPHTFDSCGRSCKCPPPDCAELMADAARFRQANCWTYMSGSLYILSRPLAEEVSRRAGYWDQHKEGDEDMMTGRSVMMFATSHAAEVAMWDRAAAGSMFAPFGAWKHTGGVQAALLVTGLWAEGARSDGDLPVLAAASRFNVAMYGNLQGLTLLRRARYWSPRFERPSHWGSIVSLTEWTAAQHFPCSAHKWLLEQPSTEVSRACARGGKLDMLLQAARAHPGYELHVWLDPERSLASPGSVLMLNNEAMSRLALHQIAVAAFPNCSACGPSWSACSCVAGGYLVAPTGVLEEAAGLFRAKVSECLSSGLPAAAALGACLDDTVILTRLLQERPSLFQVLGSERELTGTVFKAEAEDKGSPLVRFFRRAWAPERPAVYWQPSGRFGNLMFGYASLLGIAHQNGVDHFIMADRCGAPCEDPWSCWWEAETITACGLAQLYSLPVRAWPWKFEQRVQGFWKADECWHARFDESNFYLPPVTTLKGYFQSWRYFAAVSGRVREAFRAPERARRAAERRREAIAPGNRSALACLQVRLEDKTSASEYVLPSRRYYEEAKAEIYKRLQLDGRPMAIAVTTASTNDVSWVRSSFRDWREDVHISAGTSPLDDFLFLQVACDVLVLGASTFGWWAAYTSERAQLIIAPSVILNSSNPLILEFRAEDYYPPSWLLIAPD